jgi:beta-glucosidase
VQAYLSKPDSSIDRPAVWLAGFAVVRARPGETVTARIALPERAFQHWDDGWRTEAGDYLLTVGRSVADRPLALVISGRSPGVRPR